MMEFFDCPVCISVRLIYASLIRKKHIYNFNCVVFVSPPVIVFMGAKKSSTSFTNITSLQVCTVKGRENKFRTHKSSAAQIVITSIYEPHHPWELMWLRFLPTNNF